MLCFSTFAFAQTPQGFTYQAVTTSLSGSPYNNTNIDVRASIISGTINVTVEWHYSIINFFSTEPSS